MRSLCTPDILSDQQARVALRASKMRIPIGGWRANTRRDKRCRANAATISRSEFAFGWRLRRYPGHVGVHPKDGIENGNDSRFYRSSLARRSRDSRGSSTLRLEYFALARNCNDRRNSRSGRLPRHSYSVTSSSIPLEARCRYLMTLIIRLGNEAWLDCHGRHRFMMIYDVN